METRAIAPVGRALAGPRVDVPASKSVTNRELVLSALATARSSLVVGPIDPGDDVHAMSDALVALGHMVRWERDRIDITPRARRPARVDAHEAGTVARFGLALAALGAEETVFDGSARLRERPIAPLVKALRALGATIDAQQLPLRVRGPLRGGSITIAADESSQFASALLLAGPRMETGLRLRVAGDVVSAPFIEMTIGALADRGVRVERPRDGEYVVAPQTVAAFRAILPLTDRIIHCRWSGESNWIPWGDRDLGIGPENATSYPHPGEIALYPGGQSETELLFPYGYCSFASKAARSSSPSPAAFRSSRAPRNEDSKGRCAAEISRGRVSERSTSTASIPSRLVPDMRPT